MELKYELIDNFLDDKTYSDIKLFLNKKTTPWYFMEKDTLNPVETSKNGFFSLCAYNNWLPDNIDFYNVSLPVLKKLDCFIPIQVRANLCLRDVDAIECNWHKDFNMDIGITAILYFTTCNAKTLLKIKDQIISVESLENRLLKFSSPIAHKVVYQTDVHKRIVINFNYLKWN